MTTDKPVGLSEENSQLFNAVCPSTEVRGYGSSMVHMLTKSDINRLLDAARAEGARRAQHKVMATEVTEAFQAGLHPAHPVAGEWRTIESAPRDGKWILALVGNTEARWEHLNGRLFVVRHDGKTASGFDLGWSVYPGLGGASDRWFTHWMPLPSPPNDPTPRGNG